MFGVAAARCCDCWKLAARGTEQFGWWALPRDEMLTSQRFLKTVDFIHTGSLEEDELLLYALTTLCRKLTLECIMPRFLCSRYKALPGFQGLPGYVPHLPVPERVACGVNYAVPSMARFKRFLGRMPRAPQIQRRLESLGFVLEPISLKFLSCTPGKGDAFTQLKAEISTTPQEKKMIWELSHRVLLCAASYTGELPHVEELQVHSNIFHATGEPTDCFE